MRFGLVIDQWTQREVPVPRILFPPATSPSEHSNAWAGIIEPSSQNISVSTPFSEVIAKVFVVEGDLVKAGDPLFQLDL
ncbi:MAG: biotin/lipoyl-binding protein [Parachlamydiaceae bacterium]|nr:biotin/lipoyl-binding protein [Parachlamydiaceae bacterium]